MSYSVQNIRNVCLLGHGGSGKTSLAESLLYMTGAIDRMGKPADGNTVCDYDAEETRRQISISTSVAPLEYKGCKINILDTPGSFDFSGEVLEALQVSDAAIIVCSAKDGISVGLEKAWRYCEERDMPRFIYISKTDEENSDYNATFDALRERFGNKIAPIVVPIWDDNKKVTGIIDVLNKRAYEMQNGKRVEIELPEGKEDVVTQFNDALKESVAETSEGVYGQILLRRGLHLCGDDPGPAPGRAGAVPLPRAVRLRRVHHGLPDADGQYRGASAQPGGGQHAQGHAPQRRQGGIRSLPPAASPAPLCSKRSPTSTASTPSSRSSPAPSPPTWPWSTPAPAPPRSWAGCTPCGARRPWRSRSSPAAISAPSAKLEKVKTGDTLCDARKVFFMPPIPFPEPCYSVAIVPKTRGQEDKIAQGLARLNEEDPTFTLVNNGETHQMVLSGTGDMQMDVLVSKLKSRFNVEAELKAPRVAYREKIRKTVSKQGRHKSRPAVPASSAMSGSALSPIRRATRWSLPRRFSAAPCPRTISRCGEGPA